VSYSILIIDDDPATHEILGLYLSRAGYRVLRAEDGAQGLELLRSELPDLALLDVQMPVLDGFQTLERARRDPELAELPILLLTSLDRHNLKVKGLELGADDYIVKPFHAGEVLARVKTALRRSGRYRRIAGALDGDCATVSLAELLQTIELGRKTAQVRLVELKATLYLEQGQLVRTEFGAFTGKEALLRILWLERGSFQARFGELPEYLEREPQSVHAALLDCLTYLDELGEILGGKVDALLEETAPLPASAARLKPLPLKEYLCQMEGELKHNAQLMLNAAQAGLVRLVG